jgi:hypothetical protein
MLRLFHKRSFIGPTRIESLELPIPCENPKWVLFIA